VHELLGHALEADAIARGTSKLARAASPIAGAGVTVLDDPRRARVAWRIDDEGSEARPTALVQGGRVVGALACWRWPGAAGTSTGHGRRASFAEPALPRMGATFLTPGPLHAEEVMEGIGQGIYIRRLAAAWTDPSEGTASFHVTDADAIVEGRLGAPLEPFLLLARVEDLASLDRIADDLVFDRCMGVCVREGQALASTVGAPTFRLGLTTVPV
jgi:predicted Zn-dependent protease